MAYRSKNVSFSRSSTEDEIGLTKRRLSPLLLSLLLLLCGGLTDDDDDGESKAGKEFSMTAIDLR